MSSVKSASIHFTKSDIEDLALLSKDPITSCDLKLRPFKPDWNFIKEYRDHNNKSKDDNISNQDANVHCKLLKNLQVVVDGKYVKRGEQGMVCIEVQVDNSPRIVVYCFVCHEMHSNSKRNQWADGILITAKSTTDRYVNFAYSLLFSWTITISFKCSLT